MLQPTNLHLLIGMATPAQTKVLDLILRDQVNLRQSLVLLSRYWKLKIWFSEPIAIAKQLLGNKGGVDYNDKYNQLSKGKQGLVRSDCHVLSKIWPVDRTEAVKPMPEPTGSLKYSPRRNSWYGILFPDFYIDKIIKYDVLPDKVTPIWRYSKYIEFIVIDRKLRKE